MIHQTAVRLRSFVVTLVILLARLTGPRRTPRKKTVNLKDLAARSRVQTHTLFTTTALSAYSDGLLSRLESRKQRSDHPTADLPRF